jgi:hypothetical protein
MKTRVKTRNLKHETRNPKQIRMTQIRMSQIPGRRPLSSFGFWAFVLVSHFAIRVSDLAQADPLRGTSGE